MIITIDSRHRVRTFDTMNFVLERRGADKSDGSPTWRFDGYHPSLLSAFRALLLTAGPLDKEAELSVRECKTFLEAAVKRLEVLNTTVVRALQAHTFENSFTGHVFDEEEEPASEG